jgi:hypothetical protein
VIANHSIFIDNFAAHRGGAISIAGLLGGDGLSLSAINCVFHNNRAFSSGGSFDVSLSDVRITNCLFTGDWSKQGAMFFVTQSTFIMVIGFLR